MSVLKLESDDPVYGLKLVPKDAIKKINSKKNATDFKRYSEHERVWIRPDIYMGSCEMIPRMCAVFNFELHKIQYQEITVPKALERLFLEILTNASDGIRNSNSNGVKADTMYISISPQEITIINTGLPIPIQPHPDLIEGDGFGTTADLIFGNIGSGSNLDDEYERAGAGANGLGAKLTNIFSTYFNVEVGDNITGCHQEITWSRNMVTKNESVCTPPYVKVGNNWKLKGEKYTGENFVRVTWRTDFRKFREKEEDYHYNIEDLSLFMQHIITSSLSSCVKIDLTITDFFDEEFHEIIDYRDINRVAELISPSPESRITSYMLTDQSSKRGKKKEDEPEEKRSKREIVKGIVSGEITPCIQLCVIDSPNNGFHISHCNGIPNALGGVHTDEAYRSSLDFVKDILISDKSFKMNKEDVEKMNITIMKKHAVVIVSYNCASPGWYNQEKEKISGPKPKISISKDEAKNIKKWSLLETIYDSYHSKSQLKNKPKKKRIVTEGFQDANLVGVKGIHCTAIPCEGKSAGGYVDEFIMSLTDPITGRTGFDVFAKIPLRGKLRNIHGLSLRQIDAPLKSGEQNEIVKFLEIIGFEDGIDYTDPKNAERLRYQYILIMVDGDSDGSHILCLLINIIFIRFPSFIKAGRLMWAMTPILRAMGPNDRVIEKFYTNSDYREWKEENPNIKHVVEYFKGLGSSSRELAKEDAKNAPNVVLYFDDEAEIYLNVAFSQDSGAADVRKEWIQAFKDHIDDRIVEEKKQGKNVTNFVKISNLINTKLVEYSLETLPRALVSFYDHLKLSQRQVIYYMLETYNYGNTKKDKQKLSEVAGGASLMCKYHHGDLAPTISKLPEDFAGSNNLPFGTRGGMIGTRTYLGKDCAAARYVTTSTNWWVKMLFKKDLVDLIPRNVVEGKDVEPKWIPCLLPLAIINGTKGISTGWSCSMTNYHPGDVCKWILRYITGQKVFPMVPWYIKFTGNVVLEMKNKVYKKTHMDFSDEDENNIPTYTGLTCRTEGRYKIHREYEKSITLEEPDPDNPEKMRKVTKVLPHYDIEVFEVPIGVEPNKLLAKLSAKSENGRKCSKDSDYPHYMFEGYHGSVDPLSLGMVAREGLTNITMVDDIGAPVSYKNIYEVMDTFCGVMSDLFEQHKENKIKHLRQELETNRMKLLIVQKVIDGEWVFVKASKKKIETDLSEFGVPMKIFRSIGSEQYTEYGALELMEDARKIEEKIKLIEETSHLDEWVEHLEKFEQAISTRKEYKKLPIHEYDIVECDIQDLIEGKILAPYELTKNGK